MCFAMGLRTDYALGYCWISRYASVEPEASNASQNTETGAEAITTQPTYINDSAGVTGTPREHTCINSSADPEHAPPVPTEANDTTAAEAITVQPAYINDSADPDHAPPIPAKDDQVDVAACDDFPPSPPQEPETFGGFDEPAGTTEHFHASCMAHMHHIHSFDDPGMFESGGVALTRGCCQYVCMHKHLRQ